MNSIPRHKVTVFAVWEPILLTDWSRPTTPALGRMSDRRVVQFWDKEHVLAIVLAASRGPGSRGRGYTLGKNHSSGCRVERGLPPPAVIAAFMKTK